MAQFCYAGSLQPLSLRYSCPDDAAIIMDLLVTAKIESGVVIGFRFFSNNVGYLDATSSVSVSFHLSTCLFPGNFIRLQNGGKELVRVKVMGDETSGSCSRIAPVCTLQPRIKSKMSCFIFAVNGGLSKPKGIAFIGFEVWKRHKKYEGFELPIAPPTAILPCPFTTIVRLPKDGPSATYAIYKGTGPAIFGDWSNAWQLFKYAGEEHWPTFSSSDYIDTVEAVERALFIALRPGQLIPVAYRPFEESREQPRVDCPLLRPPHIQKEGQHESASRPRSPSISSSTTSGTETHTSHTSRSRSSSRSGSSHSRSSSSCSSSSSSSSSSSHSHSHSHSSSSSSSSSASTTSSVATSKRFTRDMHKTENKRKQKRGLAAHLVLAVTETIPPNTRVYIVPNASDESNVRQEALWVWTSPLHNSLQPGVIVRLEGLGFGYDPDASVGTVATSGTWPEDRFSILAFTLYSLSASASPYYDDDTAYAITALYSCKHAYPIPRGLFPGQSMSLLPWPCFSSFLTRSFCKVLSPSEWVCLRLVLLSQIPRRWLC